MFGPHDRRNGIGAEKLVERVWNISRSLLVPVLLGAVFTGVSGCDDEDYYRHAYYSPAPPVVVQAPAASPPAYYAPPPACYAPPDYYYGGYGEGEHEGRDGD